MTEAKDAPSEPIQDDENVLDNVLKHVGPMGRYQKILFVFMCPCAYYFAFLYFIQMFIAATPENHWCKIPELSHLSMEVRRKLAAPVTETGNVNNCFTYDVNWTEVAQSLAPPPPTTKQVPCKHGWDFEFSDITYETIVTERGWVCDDAKIVPTAQAVFFGGAFIGSIFFGWLADRYGRVPALTSVNVVCGIGGILTIFTTAAWDFMLARFITGMSFDNIFYMCYILVLEYTGPEHRSMVANLSVALFFGSGCFVLLGLALLLRDWRLLMWCTSLPPLLMVFTPLIIPESARWYLSQGLVTRAVKILHKFEKINKKKIPDEAMQEFIDAGNHLRQSKEGLKDLIRSIPLRRTTILMLFVYMSCALGYDVLVRMADVFGLNFFLTFALMSATEIPAVALLAFVLDRGGRRFVVFLTLVVGGILVLIAMFVPKGLPQAGFAILARFCLNMSWNGTAQWATELMPTPVRATASSALHMSGHVISMLSPYIAYSERWWAGMPLMIVGTVMIAGGGIANLLPETNGLSMPQTMADGEKIVYEYSFLRNTKVAGIVEWTESVPSEKREREVVMADSNLI